MYVRLPGGVYERASEIVGGQPPQSQRLATVESGAHRACATILIASSERIKSVGVEYRRRWITPIPAHRFPRPFLFSFACAILPLREPTLHPKFDLSVGVPPLPFHCNLVSRLGPSHNPLFRPITPANGVEKKESTDAVQVPSRSTDTAALS